MLCQAIYKEIRSEMGVIARLAGLFVVVLAAGGAPPCAAKAAAALQKKDVPPAPLVVGYWYTEHKEAGVELYACEQKICGRFRWLSPSGGGEDPRDGLNPDDALRHRPLCAMQFMGGFQQTMPDRYEDGWVYSPEHGATFDAEIRVVDRDTIELHGYLLVPAFGDSQRWTRDTAMPDCAKPAKDSKPKKGKAKKEKRKKVENLENAKVKP